ncbi:MAG: zinc-finger domain-containing protein [Burkholderiales bacterium]
MSATDQLPVVELEAGQLPAFCPNPSMPVWCHHPRVYLDIASSGFARCPYCGTGYRLKGDAPAGH